MPTNLNYRKLQETEMLEIGHIFEDFYLKNKLNEQIILLGAMYGEPHCACIDKNNKWALVGGETLFIWIAKEIVELKDEQLCDIFKIRQLDDKKVKILTDPWAENAAIWEFNVETKEKFKLKSFDSYKDKPYTEEIEW